MNILEYKVDHKLQQRKNESIASLTDIYFANLKLYVVRISLNYGLDIDS